MFVIHNFSPSILCQANSCPVNLSKRVLHFHVRHFSASAVTLAAAVRSSSVHSENPARRKGGEIITLPPHRIHLLCPAVRTEICRAHHYSLVMIMQIGR